MNSRQEHGAAATHTRILDIAERLVQTRGFNGFSYADIASEVGITKASLHYHFATKAELGVTLIARYSEAFAAALQRISATPADAARRLRAYVKLYADVLADQRMCLCGMVAAEYATLPPPMQTAIRAFFELNEGWVAQQLELGVRSGALALRVPARDAARMLVGALEGEMLVARAWGDPGRFAAAAALLLGQLAVRAADGRVARRPRSRAGARGHSARVPGARI
ncbi:MAG TPA: TetR/AcrR family transcriptional regulator [Steroidobacteraceae bacterium]|nr:TetR/AcrR family transcriptional regulator [Steroidobacteraceae bacterium]